MQYFCIGDIIFRWQDEEHCIFKSGVIGRFEIDSSKAVDYTKTVYYNVKAYPLDIYRNVVPIKKNVYYDTYDTNKGELCILHWGKCYFAYAFYKKDIFSENELSLYCNENLNNVERIPLNIGEVLESTGIHSKLLQYGGSVLHSCYIDYKGNSILFTAPSETGKSTQGRLWEKYMGAHIINEDRTLIRKRNSRWMSYGYPCCGSSDICINKTMPIKAIVFLEQGKENRIEEMSNIDKIRAIVSGTEVFKWVPEEIEMSIRQAQAIINDILIVKLICRPDKEAVDVLKEYLEGK